MNFTREPIIETIITPKEGSKLLIRNSKREAKDDYLVDAIEVISFGNSIFYRSLERPKSFVVPVSDYEVVEVKEVRLALKSASVERSIKIGGGRIKPRSSSESVKEKAAPEEEAEGRSEKKRERRRPRRRKSAGEKEIREDAPARTDDKPEEKKRSTRLLPPPPTLISETIGKYRDAIHPDAAPLPKVTEGEEEKKAEPKKRNTKKKDEPKPAKDADKPEPPKEESAPPPKEETAPKKPKGEGEDKSSFWGLFS